MTDKPLIPLMLPPEQVDVLAQLIAAAPYGVVAELAQNIESQVARFNASMEQAGAQDAV